MAEIISDQVAEEAVDAVALLKRDHQVVSQLFDDVQRAADLQLEPLVRRICKLLKIHAQIEEELFYPAARQALRDPSLIDEAEAEHVQAKRSIVHIESMSASDPDLRQQMQQLAEQVQAHVAEEEGVIFGQVRESSLDLIALGTALAERRYTLMDVLGLHEDDERTGTPRPDGEVAEAQRRLRAAARAKEQQP